MNERKRKRARAKESVIERESNIGQAREINEENASNGKCGAKRDL